MAKDSNNVNIDEHEAPYGVKRVSNFISNGSGGLVRQAGDSSGNISVATASFTSVTSFNAVNNTAGTAVNLPSAACKVVEIFVPTGNTGQQVAVGASNVKAAVGSELGSILISGVLQQFPVSNANLLWFDVITSGDKISYNLYS